MNTPLDSAATAAQPIHVTLQQLQAYTILLQKLSCYLVCLFAVLLWDFLVTFHDEVKYVWLSSPSFSTAAYRRWTWRWFTSRINLVKIAFAVNRYLTIVLMTFMLVCIRSVQVMQICGEIHLVQPLLPIPIFFSSNFLLITRCSALYNGKFPVVFWGLLSLATVQAIVQIACSLKNAPIPLPPGTIGCFSNPSRENEAFGFIYWVLPLVTQSITFLLTVYKVLRRWHITGRSKLFRAFLKDGVQYFAVVTSANLVDIVYMKSKIRINGVYIQVGSFASHIELIQVTQLKMSSVVQNAPMAGVMTSMMVSRLLIHMRKIARRQASLPQLKEDIQSVKIDTIELRKALPSSGLDNAVDSPTCTIAEHYQQQLQESASQIPVCLYK